MRIALVPGTVSGERVRRARCGAIITTARLELASGEYAHPWADRETVTAPRECCVPLERGADDVRTEDEGR